MRSRESPGPLFQFHHQPFAYFANYAFGTPGAKAHLKDEKDFIDGIEKGELPPVVFFKPSGEDNEHPGYSSILAGEYHTALLIGLIQRSALWKDTAIIVTYDENGGLWDHVAPPGDRPLGPGHARAALADFAFRQARLHRSHGDGHDGDRQADRNALRLEAAGNARRRERRYDGSVRFSALGCERDSFPIGVVTISDRASAGVYEDKGGPGIEAALAAILASPWRPVRRVIPDERARIEATLCELADVERCSLILTTGGTGPAPRDVTPEATEAVCERMMPGFGELMRTRSLLEVPTAILSRQTAGLRGRSLIVNLPGKPSAIRTCLDAVFPAIPYCLDLIGGDRLETNPEACVAFRPKA